MELEKESIKPELDLSLDNFQVQFVNAAQSVKKKVSKQTFSVATISKRFSSIQ